LRHGRESLQGRRGDVHYMVKYGVVADSFI
jgi:hypothetical protein